ncbi:MAG: hypothetical protein WBX35_26560 [Pseudolabrys sp.]
MNGALSVCEKRVQLINSCWLLRSCNKRVVWEAQRDARATIRRFNARLSAKGYSWFWPKIAAALTQNITGSLSIATVAALGLLLCENLPLIMDAAVLFKLSALCDFH